MCKCMAANRSLRISTFPVYLLGLVALLQEASENVSWRYILPRAPSVAEKAVVLELGSYHLGKEPATVKGGRGFGSWVHGHLLLV